MTSHANDVEFTPRQSLPVEHVLKVTPFPSPRVTNEGVSLSALVKGKTSVLHLYTCLLYTSDAADE